MLQRLGRLGLLADPDGATFEALAGGVSSDIWKVHADGRTYCVKRALSRLKVEADWFAPVERNLYEVAWYQIANEIVPGSAPKILAHDQESMLCVMQFLDPLDHELWKSMLLDGHADPIHATRVGHIIGQIHSRTASNKKVEDRFPPNDIFQKIRLEPYLEATADKHPDLKSQLFTLSQKTAQVRLTMIHGDVSPKNILIGPDGPVFLDAECACIGDPAFDLAFCLNHFLLKCIPVPSAEEDFIECFGAMTSAYLLQVDWEDADHLEARAAKLLPGLFLARVDGKSPVEYITETADKDRIRYCARQLLFKPPTKLNEVAHAWQEVLSQCAQK